LGIPCSTRRSVSWQGMMFISIRLKLNLFSDVKRKHLVIIFTQTSHHIYVGTIHCLRYTHIYSYMHNLLGNSSTPTFR
jgi:hypothetical protein